MHIQIYFNYIFGADKTPHTSSFVYYFYFIHTNTIILHISILSKLLKQVFPRLLK